MVALVERMLELNKQKRRPSGRHGKVSA